MLLSWLLFGSGILFGLAAQPVRAGFLLVPDHPLVLGVTAGPFRLQIHVSIIETEVGHALCFRLPRSENVLPIYALRTAQRPSVHLGHALTFFTKVIRIDRLDGSVVLSGNDAARSCIIASILRIAFSAASSLFPNVPLTARIGIDFSGKSRARALGIFSCRFGHIMLVALIVGRDLLIRRLKSWKNTLLKAS